jgi:hypothetical protein
MNSNGLEQDPVLFLVNVAVNPSGLLKKRHFLTWCQLPTSEGLLSMELIILYSVNIIHSSLYGVAAVLVSQ